MFADEEVSQLAFFPAACETERLLKGLLHTIQIRCWWKRGSEHCYLSNDDVAHTVFLTLLKYKH